MQGDDLIKNQIFSLYPKQTHLDEPNDTWQRIVSNLNDNPRFLNNYWASRYKKIAEHKLFKEFYNEFVKPKKDMKFFLNDLEKFSINYKKVTDPSLSDWNRSEYEIYFSLNAIVKIFNIDVANTFLINLIEDYNAKRVSKAKELFPDPEGPIIHTTSPSEIDKLISFNLILSFLAVTLKANNLLSTFPASNNEAFGLLSLEANSTSADLIVNTAHDGVE